MAGRPGMASRQMHLGVLVLGTGHQGNDRRRASLPRRTPAGQLMVRAIEQDENFETLLREILEQAAGKLARAHRISASARWRSDWGIVRPRALAVFMLMTSSNLVGCSTGR